VTKPHPRERSRLPSARRAETPVEFSGGQAQPGTLGRPERAGDREATEREAHARGVYQVTGLEVDQGGPHRGSAGTNATSHPVHPDRLGVPEVVCQVEEGEERTQDQLFTVHAFSV
jgi:hypothetical protein